MRLLTFFIFCISLLEGNDSVEVFDYFKNDWSHLERKSGVVDNKSDGPLNFKVLKVKNPGIVEAGEFVVMEVIWEKTSGPDYAICYVNAFGNWAPDKALDATPLGPAGPSGTPKSTEIRFKAPSEAGHYKIRWLLTPGFTGQESYFGREDIGVEMPGRAFWSEFALKVVAPVDESLR